MFMRRALAGAPVSPVPRSPAIGLAGSLGGRLGAAFLPMQCVYSFAAAFGSPPASSQKPQRPNQLVYKNGWSLLPLQQAKNYTDAASKAFRKQRLRSAGKRANFSAAKNLPFCLKEYTRIKRCQGGRKD
jgi:hypothetical protein